MIPLFLEKVNKQSPIVKQERKRKDAGKEKKVKEDISDSLFSKKIEKRGRSFYCCSHCKKLFNRQATLRRHHEFAHANVDSLEPDDRVTSTKKRFLSRIGKVTRPFACDICNARFKEVNVLKAHIKTHSNVKDYPCSFESCNFAFRTKGSLKRHMRRHTGERPFKCHLCSRSFAESGALTRHLKSRTPCTSKSDTDFPRYGKRLDLTFPPTSLSSNSEIEVPLPDTTSEELPLNNNIKELDESQSIIILPPDGDIDSATSNEAINLKIIHVATETENYNQVAPEPSESSFLCKVCHEIFENELFMKKHLDLHIGERPLRCGLCFFVTASKEHLSAHMHIKHNTTLQQSITVDSEIVSQDTMEKFAYEESDEDRKAALAMAQLAELQNIPTTKVKVDSVVHGFKNMHKCTVCSRSFRGFSYLRLHMRIHTGEKPFECHLCKKKFTAKDTLRKHMISHSEERNYKCGECGKMYKRITHVREHLRVHSAERPHVCSLCSKGFKTLNAMKVHIKTHTNYLPFECEICQRKFREKGSLQRHVRTHTGEKPFVCKHCGRRFAEHGTLNRHLKAKIPCYQDDTVFDCKKESDYPTVLAEFSSVVADTQHYIIQTVNTQTQTLSEAEGVASVDGTNSYVIITQENLPQSEEGVTIMNEEGEVTLIETTEEQILPLGGEMVHIDETSGVSKQLVIGTQPSEMETVELTEVSEAESHATCEILLNSTTI